MLNKTMLDIGEVLELVDLKMGYGVDSYSREVFQQLLERDEQLHLVPSKAMRRYMNSYIKRKFKEKYGREPVTYEDFDSIIKIEGDGKGRKYEKTGILSMLEDQKIYKLIQDRLEEDAYPFKSHQGEDMIIPNFVWDYYYKKANGEFEDIEQAEFYATIKDDTTDSLKMKLSIIQQEIETRESFEKVIEEYDEVKGSRSPESLYSFLTSE